LAFLSSSSSRVMVRWLPSIPYPPERDGFWLPVTSTINWCEEDYYATIYSAEIVNTLTNLFFLGLGVNGLRNCLKYKHDSIFIVSFVGYLLVGTGSFLFHTTLKYPMQLVDELSMIYTTCLMCYACFSYATSRSFSFALGIGLLALCIFITVVYHYLQDPTFHQIAYGILTAVVLFRSMYLMEVNIRPSLRAKYGTVRRKSRSTLTEEEVAANDARDRRILRDMWWMIAVGLSIFLGGFGFWNLDNAYCSTLRRWRHEIGLPWGVLLEFHGLWHMMTGTGAYFYLVWGIWLRHCLNERQDEYQLRWPSAIFSLPAIVFRTRSPAPNDSYAAVKNAPVNGLAKKYE